MIVLWPPRTDVMRLTEAFIDANLLVLLVVGSVDRMLVARHRRTRTFLPEVYDRLVEVIRKFIAGGRREWLDSVDPAG